MLVDVTTVEGEGLGFTKMGEDKNQKLGVSKEIFIKHLSNEISGTQTTRKEFFIAIHRAYARALNKAEISDKRIVFQLHHPCPINTSVLIKDFPQARFIHTTRMPITGLLSLYKHYYFGVSIENPRSYNVDRIFWDLAWGIFPLHLTLLEGSRAIRLEDLHKAPEKTLQSLIQFVDLPWDDSLLQSTFDGKKWWNVASAPSLSGFNKVTTQKDRHKELLTGFDQWRYESLFSPLYERLNYEKIASKGLLRRCIEFLFYVWFPFKIERLGYKFSKKRGLFLLKYYIATRLVLMRMFFLLHFSTKLIWRWPFIDFKERKIFKLSSIKAL